MLTPYHLSVTSGGTFIFDVQTAKTAKNSAFFRHILLFRFYVKGFIIYVSRYNLFCRRANKK